MLNEYTHNERDVCAFGIVVRELVHLIEELILCETLYPLYHQIGYL